ncbi:hypothetical protein EVAR_77690_1 [Eumeta japonica]|uniref:Uncharacterized protein n=1 Tax=Eumeta variegata TaxID=151549 RepID=A0A4C1S9F5_EUMVA|nr:hypothetical protein EVAR_77690_1 [Eumeta japonica]
MVAVKQRDAMRRPLSTLTPHSERLSPSTVRLMLSGLLRPPRRTDAFDIVKSIVKSHSQEPFDSWLWEPVRPWVSRTTRNLGPHFEVEAQRCEDTTRQCESRSPTPPREALARNFVYFPCQKDEH